LLAIQILATSNTDLLDKLIEYKKQIAKESIAKNDERFR